MLIGAVLYRLCDAAPRAQLFAIVGAIVASCILRRGIIAEIVIFVSEWRYSEYIDLSSNLSLGLFVDLRS